MEEEIERITLTKADVVVRQFDMAISLWAEDADPVPVHTLVAAAHDIVDDLLRNAGLRRTLVGDTKYVRQGMEKEYRKVMKESANFFKHADRDSDSTHDFLPFQTEYLLYGAIEGFKRLGYKPSPRMLAFWIRFVLSNSQFFDESLLPIAKKLLPVDKLRMLSKKEFIEYFQPAGVSDGSA